MPTELGTAYISIGGRTDGLRKDIEKALNGVEKTGATQGRNYGRAFGSGASGEMSTAGKSSASRFSSSFESEANTRATRIGSAVGKAIGFAVVGAAGAATAGLGAVLFKGLDRYKSLDATAHRLGAMGKSAADVKSILSDINEVVEGTPIALDEASKSATQFLAAGVKQGKPLKDMLKSIADAAGFSGDSFDSIAQGFIQVNNAGKVTAEDIQNQFRNLPVIPWLAKSMGTDPASIKTMISDGKIGVQNLIDAVEQNAGGMAKAAGDTIDGALRNMSTALAKTGANLLSAIFGDPLSTTDGPGGMVEALNKVNAKLNDVNDWVVAHQGEIKQFFSDAAHFVGDVASALGNVAGFLKDHPALVQAAAAAYLAFKGAQVVGSIQLALNKILELDGAIGKGAGSGATGLIGGVYTLAAALGVELGFTIFDKMKQGAREAQAAIDAANASLHAQFPGQPVTPGGLAAGTGSTAPSNPLNPNNIYGPSAPTVGGGAAGPRNPGLPTGGRGGPGAPATSYGPLIGGGGSLPSPASIAGIAKAQALNGLPYTPGTLDCSGYVSQVYSAMVGKNVHFTTMADFAALGFKRGYMPGALNIGNIPKPGNSGHMAATLPNGVNIESGGTSGPVSYNSGPGAMGKQFTEQWYFMPGMAPGFVDGGPVAGKPGPDQILAWLSDGEHVWTPEEVSAVGGQDKMMQLRAMASSGQLTPEAVSGMVAGPQGADATGRTEGYIPAGAGYSGKTGGGVAGSLIGLGGEAIKGAIQTAADAGKVAASVGSFGAAAAGGPAAGMGIQMGADIAKRGVDYGVEMANIGIGALSEILLPFGAPRWLSDVDPTSFVPHSGIQGAATTTAEQAVLDQQNQQQSPVDPNTMQHGQAMGAPPGPDPLGNNPTPALEPAAEIRGGDTINLYPKDVDESFRLLNQRQKLQSMQYGGRP